MSDSETCSNRLQLDLMFILENFLCELNSHIIIWPLRLNITFGWLQKFNPGYEICIISYQVNLSSEVSAMFNSLMPSLNSRSLPFVVFLGGFPSRCQNLSSGAIRPGGLLSYELGQIITRYDLLGARRVILSIQKANLVDIQSRRSQWYNFVFERTQSRLFYYIPAHASLALLFIIHLFKLT